MTTTGEKRGVSAASVETACTPPFTPRSTAVRVQRTEDILTTHIHLPSNHPLLIALHSININIRVGKHNNISLSCSDDGLQATITTKDKGRGANPRRFNLQPKSTAVANQEDKNAPHTQGKRRTAKPHTAPLDCEASTHKSVSYHHTM